MTDTTTPTTRTYEGLTLPAPGRYAVDASHSELTFSARHMMVSKVRGRFNQVEGSIDFADDDPTARVDRGDVTILR